MKRFLAAACLLALPAAAAVAAPPKVPPPPKLDFKPPRGERHVLSNGIVVWLLEDRDLPLVHGMALVRTGTVFDPPGKAGTAQLTGAAMRAGGSAKVDADKMNQALEFLGASVETGMGLESGSASFDCLSRDLDKVLGIFAGVLRAPAFREDKFQVEKQQLLEALLRRNDDPVAIARREARRALFGPDHPYGRRTEKAGIESISRKDLLDFHARFYRPESVTLALSGDFKADEMLAKLETAFGGWAGSGPPPELRIPPAAAAGRKVILIAKDNITQTALRVVQPGLKRHEPDHFAYELLDYIVGGDSFVARMWTDIRSRRGLAYSVGTGFAEWEAGGLIMAVCGTRNDAALLALKEMLGHLERVRREPVEAEELDRGKKSIANSFVFKFQTSETIIDQRAELEYYGYPADYLDTYLDRLGAADRQALLEAARRRLQPDSALIVVVGPATLAGELARFGPVEVRKPD